MQRRTMFYESPEDTPLPIDHSRLIDGFGYLTLTKFYRDRDVPCRICGDRFVLSASAQKELLEQNSIPVRSLDTGAALCAWCLPRRRRIKALRRWRSTLLEQMSLVASTAVQLRAALEARANLLESFGEGKARSGLRLINEASRRFPEASFSDLRARLIPFASNKRQAMQPAAKELADLCREEQELRLAVGIRSDPETLYPCDLDTPVTCGHCGLTTNHPLCVLGKALICPRCDGWLDE